MDIVVSTESPLLDSQRQDLLETSPVGAGIIVPGEHRLVFANQALAQLLGIPREEIPGRTLASLYRDPTVAERHEWRLSQGQSLEDQEIALLRQDGQPAWAMLSVHGLSMDQQPALVAWFRDISEHKSLEAELRHLAVTDPLSGVLNRRAFLKQASQEMARFRRHAHPLALLMLDIDHFRSINESYGQAVGDEGIRRLAAIMRTTLRDSDIIGRLGGEEFAVLLPDTDQEAALQTAERLRQTVAGANLLTAWGRVQLTISVGIGECQHDDTAIEQVLGRADRAMHLAKHGGRNRVVGSGPLAP